jgi:hypothetical protein
MFVALNIAKDKKIYLPIADIQDVRTQIFDLQMGEKIYQVSIICTMKSGAIHQENNCFLCRENAEIFLNDFLFKLYGGNQS